MKIYIVENHPILADYILHPVWGGSDGHYYYDNYVETDQYAIIDVDEDDLLVLALCGCIVNTISEKNVSDFLFERLYGGK